LLAREIVNSLLSLVLLEHGLLLRECRSGALVSAVGSNPQSVAQRVAVIINRQQVDDALTSGVEAVLLVIANADDGANQAIVAALVNAHAAEFCLSAVLVEIDHAVLDVVGPLHGLQL